MSLNDLYRQSKAVEYREAPEPAKPVFGPHRPTVRAVPKGKTRSKVTGELYVKPTSDKEWDELIARDKDVERVQKQMKAGETRVRARVQAIRRDRGTPDQLLSELSRAEQFGHQTPAEVKEAANRVARGQHSGEDLVTIHHHVRDRRQGTGKTPEQIAEERIAGEIEGKGRAGLRNAGAKGLKMMAGGVEKAVGSAVGGVVRLGGGSAREGRVASGATEKALEVVDPTGLRMHSQIVDKNIPDEDKIGSIVAYAAGAGLLGTSVGHKLIGGVAKSIYNVLAKPGARVVGATVKGALMPLTSSGRAQIRGVLAKAGLGDKTDRIINQIENGADEVLPESAVAKEFLEETKQIEAGSVVPSSKIAQDFDAETKAIEEQLGVTFRPPKKDGKTIAEFEDLTGKTITTDANLEEHLRASLDPANHLGAAMRKLGHDEAQVKAAMAALNPVLEQNPGAIFKAVQKVDPSGKLLQEWAKPFYSKLEQVVGEKIPNRASAEQIRKTLIAAGVKPEEMTWTKMDELLDQGGTITKQDILDHLQENQVRVEEVMKGGTHGEEARLKKLFTEKYGDQFGDKLTTSEASDYERAIKFGSDARANRTKFDTGNLRLPGGEDYRELLLTMPSPKSRVAYSVREMDYGNGDIRYFAGGPNGRSNALLTRAEAQMKADEMNKTYGDIDISNQSFTGSHWDEPNVLAHIRFDTRKGPNGEKILHVAEIQSDWHQRGRKEGYDSGSEAITEDQVRAELGYTIVSDGFEATTGKPGGWWVKKPDGSNAMWFKTEEEAKNWAEGVVRRRTAILENERTKKVPDAPFKKTWHELAMKRVMRYAAENDFDRVSWDTGITNAERYDLSKQVDAIQIMGDPEQGLVIQAAKPGQGFEVLASDVPLNKLEDYVGKDIARKFADEGQTDFRGLDLKVGGEGMKGFYDKILPDTANKLGKRFGAKVEPGSVAGKSGSYSVTKGENDALYSIVNDLDGKRVSSGWTYEEAAEWATRLNKETVGVPVHSMAITPEMKASLLNEGQPLFQKARKVQSKSLAPSETGPATQGARVARSETPVAFSFADQAFTGKTTLPDGTVLQGFGGPLYDAPDMAWASGTEAKAGAAIARADRGAEVALTISGSPVENHLRSHGNLWVKSSVENAVTSGSIAPKELLEHAQRTVANFNKINPRNQLPAPKSVDEFMALLPDQSGPQAGKVGTFEERLKLAKLWWAKSTNKGRASPFSYNYEDVARTTQEAAVQDRRAGDVLNAFLVDPKGAPSRFSYHPVYGFGIPGKPLGVTLKGDIFEFVPKAMRDRATEVLERMARKRASDRGEVWKGTVSEDQIRSTVAGWLQMGDQGSGGFAPDAVMSIRREVLKKFLAQQEGKDGIKGAYYGLTRVIELVQGKADISTVIHKVAHDFHGFLKTHAEWGEPIKRVYGDTTKGAEQFARHFEDYLRTGKAPVKSLQTVFNAIRDWMRGIYRTWSHESAPDEIKAIFNKVYAKPSERTLQLTREYEDFVRIKAKAEPKASTALANRVQDVEAEKGVIPESPRATGTKQGEAHAKGKVAVEAGDIDPEALAREIAEGKRTFKDETEVGALIEGKRRLVNARDALRAKMKAAQASGEGVEAAEVKFAEAQLKLEEFVNNVQSGKGKWSDVGRALQEGTTLADGEFEDALAVFRAQRKKEGGTVSQKEYDALKKDFDDLQKAQAAKATGDIETLKAKAQEGFERIATRRGTPGRRTVAQIADEKQAVRESLRKSFEKFTKPTSAGSGLGNFSDAFESIPEIARDLRKLIELHIEEFKLTRMNPEFYASAKDAVRASLDDADWEELGIDPKSLGDDDITRLLAGYYERTSGTAKGAQNTVAELKRQARKMTQIMAALEGDVLKYGSAAGVPDASATMMTLKTGLKALLDDIGLGPAQEATRKKLREMIAETEEHLKKGTRPAKDAAKIEPADIEAMRKQLKSLQKDMRLEDTIADLEWQLASGELKGPSKRVSTSTKAQADQEAKIKVLRQAINSKLNADTTIMGKVRQIGRNMRLASIQNRLNDVVQNLGSTASELAGKGGVTIKGKTFGLGDAEIDQLLWNRLNKTQGRASGHVTGKMIKNAVAGAKERVWDEIVEQMKTGNVAELEKYGIFQEAPGVFKYIGRATGTTDISFRDFWRRVIKQELEVVNPKITDEEIDLIIADEELAHVFTNDANFISDKFTVSKAMKAAERSTKGSEWGQFLMLGVDTVMPFPKVLANVAGRATDYAGGGAKALIKYANVRASGKAFSIAERRVINSLVRRQLHGIALFAAGGYLYKNHVLAPKEVNPSSGFIKWGHKMERMTPPAAKLLMLGAMHGWMAEHGEGLSDSEREALTIGAITDVMDSTIAGGVETSAKAMARAGSAGKVLAKALTSFIPSQFRSAARGNTAFEQWMNGLGLAAYEEEPGRYAKGFSQGIKGEIPAARNQLPEVGAVHPEMGRLGVEYSERKARKGETPEQLAIRNRDTRARVREEVARYITSSEYKALTDKEKRTTLAEKVKQFSNNFVMVKPISK